MKKVVAINGSPRTQHGDTAMILGPFLDGLTGAGCEVELFYASRLDVRPCTCGEMYCWYRKPGECCIKDDMEILYPKVREADLLVLATPVYTPLPCTMQAVLNRLCPLVKPLLAQRAGRTRARFHDDVRIESVVLVSTGGWWEKENFGTVVRIAEELAENGSVRFAGSVLRPHAFLMKSGGTLTKDGRAVVDAARQAGRELAEGGAMSQETLDAVSRPLISEEELRQRYNRLVQT